MKKYIIILLVFILGYFIINHFLEKNCLILNKTTFSDVDEKDTIETFPERGIYVLGLVRDHTFGRFTYSIGVMKQDVLNLNSSISYEIKDSKNEFRVSKDYFVKESNSYNKEKVFRILDSIFYLKERPDKLKIYPIK